jgi:FkbM family methyltransferase
MTTPSQSSAFPSVGGWVARNRRKWLLRKMAGACRRYLSWYANVSYELEENGEGFVLDTLSRFQPTTVLDVGANVGDWSSEALRRCTGAQVYAFEISPPTFAALQQRLGSNARLHCRNTGLADHEGSIRIRHYEKYPALTTATAYPHPAEFRELEAQVTTGDRMLAAERIAHIDLLKIDVEGMEKQVLLGLQEAFSRGAIDLVQFEYGRVSIVNKELLSDFYSFFTARGYVVGKIYPNYVDFRAYDLGDEDFLGPNFLACRAARTDYVAAFGGGHAPA